MHENKVHRVWVLEGDYPVGVVSMSDVIAALGVTEPRNVEECGGFVSSNERVV